MQHHGHPYSKWEVSGASHCSQRGRSPCCKSCQPFSKKCFHSLVYSNYYYCCCSILYFRRKITLLITKKKLCLEHRHGIRQLQSGWYDGPSYITQCPIQTGQTYVYNFAIVGQRGTLFWHAHISWLRATLYGPIIILPKRGVPYPFPKPYKQVPILFGK